MKTVSVTIKGATPLLIHRFDEGAETGKSSRKQMVKVVDPRKEAEKAAYIAEDGTYYFSAFAIPGTMGAAGSNHKMRGSRKSLRFVVPAAIRVLTDTVTILDDEGNPAKDFEVDARPVTIPATKGRVMRYRPRFNKWQAKFDLQIDDDQLDPDTAHQLLNEAGLSNGIGDFRPEKRGPFGTFLVTQFQESTNTVPTPTEITG